MLHKYTNTTFMLNPHTCTLTSRLNLHNQFCESRVSWARLDYQYEKVASALHYSNIIVIGPSKVHSLPIGVFLFLSPRVTFLPWDSEFCMGS